jgi:hypothetical protein
LLIVAGRLQVADFGLAQLLWLPARQPVAQFNLRYSPPELFEDRVSRSSDQYSLAIIFQEMLTGVHPFRGQPRPRGSGDRFRARPDLALLSPSDRAVIGRALSRDPDRRYPSCGDFLQALEPGPAPPQADDREPEPETEQPVRLHLPSIITWPAADALLAVPPGPGSSLEHLLPDLLTSAAGPFRLQEHQHIGFVIRPDQSLEHRCAARLPSGVGRLKLSGFMEQWNANLVREDADTFLLRIALPGCFWLRCIGYHPGLEVEVKLLPPRRNILLTEVQVVVRPVGCPKGQATSLLNEVGPPLVASLREFLQVHPEQRTQHRLVYSQPLQVMPVQTSLHLAAPIVGQAKDISQTGIGFLLPGHPSSRQVYVNLAANKEVRSLAVLAKIVRVQPRGDGWCEVGAQFSGRGERP